MANTPAILATVKITADDINGNNVAKQFNNVSALNFDFAKGMVQVVDVTGSFYFSLGDMSSVSYTISGADFSAVTVVMS